MKPKTKEANPFLRQISSSEPVSEASLQVTAVGKKLAYMHSKKGYDEVAV